MNNIREPRLLYSTFVLEMTDLVICALFLSWFPNRDKLCVSQRDVIHLNCLGSAVGISLINVKAILVFRKG